MSPSTITGINQLPVDEKREIYARMIPKALIDRFQLPSDFYDEQGKDLLSFKFASQSPSVEMILRHQVEFPDPVQYGHLTDTMNGQIYILLYVLNDPDSPRYDIDRMPDGRNTIFGTKLRHIEAELAAMRDGLTPGQIRHGLGILHEAILCFEDFVTSLHQEIYFVDPLYYHNAVIFEKFGFAYQVGRKLMERIEMGFSPGGDLYKQLDPSNPFRKPEGANSIRLRSWAIHDGILGEPFSEVTMYKYVGKQAGIKTCFNCTW